MPPDWSADWLRREMTALRDGWAQREFGSTAANPVMLVLPVPFVAAVVLILERYPITLAY